MNIIVKTTPAYSAKILAALSSDQVAKVVDRSIGSDASLSAFGFVLQALGRRELPDDPGCTQQDLFEVKLGSEGFWRLVKGAGNLNDLAVILPILSESFRRQVLESTSLPGPEEWSALVSNSSFYGVARFARDAIGLLPEEISVHFQSAVNFGAASVVARSRWGEIGSGLAACEKVSDTALSDALKDAARERIEASTTDMLSGLEYQEATSALTVLWRQHEAYRPSLGAAIWHILPPENTWPSDHTLINQARFPLSIARSEHVAMDDALRLLRSFAPLELDVSIDPMAALHHALFLWNLYALWFERGRSVSPRFADLQHSTTWDRLVDVVSQRRDKRANRDKILTLQLSGTLAFLNPDLGPRLEDLLRGRIRGPGWCRNEAEVKLTFVPAFFVLQGLKLCDPTNDHFRPRTVRWLLAKANEYVERGPAIEELCRWLQACLR